MLIPRLIRTRRARSSAPLRRKTFSVEALEGRQLLATFTVTNVNDSGPGSLRQAIIGSNATKGSASNTIDFNLAGSGALTIALQSSLPAVTHPVTIDATTQPGYASVPRIVLDGTNAGTGVSGITFKTSQSGLKGVAVDDFSDFGVVLNGGSAVTLAGDYVGVTPAGIAAGNAHDGILLCNGAHGDTIARNVVSANGGNGIEITGGANHNLVEGTLIGPTAAGSAALGNGADGILITNSSDDNVIGGTTASAQNVMSANTNYGIHIMSGSESNVVLGNLIGTNAAGTAALGNGLSGVRISNGSDANTVGGTVAGARNVLSGNENNGIVIDYDADGNFVEGNLIGTTASGRAALGNAQDGVFIAYGSNGNIIGGITAAAQNVISANAWYGVRITGDSDANLIEGNLIGTSASTSASASGTAALGNGLFGVLIDGGSSGNVVGGSGAVAGNTIAHNTDGGVELNDAGKANAVEANVVSTNGSGQTTAGLGDGVVVISTSDTTISNNAIDFNRDWGINLENASSVLTGNTFQGNGLGDIHT
jgi:hypothetical protein